jgi:hypothetical protein
MNTDDHNLSDIPLIEVVVDIIDDENLVHQLQREHHQPSRSGNRCWNAFKHFVCNGICWCNIFWMFIVTGLVLWALSEAGLYGEGILRDKRIGEKC